MTAPRDKDGSGTEGRMRSADRLLAELGERVARRLPDWKGRGPEDPAWVLLEVFAEALAEAHVQASGLEDRLVPRLLDLLGIEPRWGRAAAGAITLVPRENLIEPVLVPRGTAVMASRRSGDPAMVFETTTDAWCAAGRLLRIVTCSGEESEEIFPYPQSGWDSGPVGLFAGRLRLDRYLYIGDPLLQLLRDRSGSIVLEWTGVPASVAEGRWEVSAHGGWRSIRVGREEVRSAQGKRSLRMRIPGSIPDIAELSIEGVVSPWIRLLLPGDRRIVLPQPTWAGADLEPAVQPRQLESLRWTGGGQVLSFPRAVFRLFSSAGDRWEDHSLSAQKIVAAESGGASDPAVYLGWDQPVPASVYWCVQGRSLPAEWGGDGGQRMPHLSWEYASGRGFRALDVEDGTESFTRSGITSWRLPVDWSPQEHFGERLYWVRARWISGSYFSPPLVRAALPNAAVVRQGRTVQNRGLDVDLGPDGRGDLTLSFSDGEPEPFGRIEIRREGMDWHQLVDEARPGGSGAGTSDAEPARGGASLPAESRSGRFHVARNAEGGYRIQVADSWSGPIRIRIPEMRIVRGAAGNLPPGTLTVLAADVAGVLRVLQPLPTAGGLDPEAAAPFRDRVLAEWQTGNRAVTALDYRRLCRAMDPEIARVEIAVGTESTARVLVCIVPAEDFLPGRFSPERLAWLEELLSARAPLGSVVEVVEPLYVPLEVRARQVEPGPVPSEATRKLLEGRLREFLHPLRGGRDRRGFAAGRGLKAVDLSAMISPFLLEGGLVGGGDTEGAASRKASEGPGGAAEHETPDFEQLSWRIRSSPVLGPGDWDPRAWRIECTFPDGASLPEGGAGFFRASPLVLPVLERLVFEPLEHNPSR